MKKLKEPGLGTLQQNSYNAAATHVEPEYRIVIDRSVVDKDFGDCSLTHALRTYHEIGFETASRNCAVSVAFAVNKHPRAGQSITRPAHINHGRQHRGLAGLGD